MPMIEILATGSGKDTPVLEQAMTYLQSLGLTARYNPEIFGDHPLYAAPDERRFHNLCDALTASDIDVLWCLRGGSGTTRLIPGLLDRSKPPQPKTVIGFSDVTALQLFLSQVWGWPCIHGPTLNYMVDERSTPLVHEIMMRLVRGEKTLVQSPNLQPLNGAAKSLSTLTAPLTGGNLSLINYSIGTSWHIDTRDKILFLEDVDEAPYRLAEMFEHLRQAGVFQHVKAVLLGRFTHTDPAKIPAHLLDFVLKDFANQHGFPVFSNLSCGHYSDNLPLLLQAPATLSQDATSAFQLTQEIQPNK